MGMLHEYEGDPIVLSKLTGKEIEEAIKVAVEVLKKEIPKKMFNEKDFGKTCSICRSLYAGGYCRMCGNRLEVEP
jgi:rRNA maturation endonuclease Nob1